MLKNYLKDKDIGFFFSVALIVFSMITAIVYAVSFGGTEDISWVSFALMIAASCSGIVLILAKKYIYAPYVLSVFIFLSLLFFIYGIYYYVSVVVVGIDLDTTDSRFILFIICSVMFILSLGVSIANLFLKQIKQEVGHDE